MQKFSKRESWVLGDESPQKPKQNVKTVYSRMCRDRAGTVFLYINKQVEHNLKMLWRFNFKHLKTPSKTLLGTPVFVFVSAF